MSDNCSCVPIQCMLTHTEQSKTRQYIDLRETYESLSPAEREVVDRDIKGTRDEIKETAQFVSQKLRELDDEFELLSDDKKRAYNQAIEVEMKQKTGSDDYIRSKKFRLMFLRADEFNTVKAAKRLAKYFEDKLDLFGVETLGRKIKQSDLTEKDKRVMLSGCVCTTGATDMHGRVIMFGRRKLMDSFDIKSIRRIFFYLFQMVEDNEEWQKKGMVVVLDARELGPLKPSLEQRLYPVGNMMFYALPLKLACCHLCYNNKMFHFFMRIALVICPDNIGPRLQTHFEKTSQEIFSSLVPYGINFDDLPLSKTWIFQVEVVRNYLKALQQKEEDST